MYFGDVNFFYHLVTHSFHYNIKYSALTTTIDSYAVQDSSYCSITDQFSDGGQARSTYGAVLVRDYVTFFISDSCHYLLAAIVRFPALLRLQQSVQDKLDIAADDGDGDGICLGGFKSQPSPVSLGFDLPCILLFDSEARDRETDKRNQNCNGDYDETVMLQRYESTANNIRRHLKTST